MLALAFFVGMKKILAVLAPHDFRDTEFLVPREFWLQSGFSVFTASSERNSVGKFGFQVENDFLLNEVVAQDFDMIFFVGGNGSLDFLENASARKIAEECTQSGKILAAICAAPRLLLAWNLLQNKKITGWNGDGELPHLAQQAGAIFVEGGTCRDKNIITGNEPSSAEEFANLVSDVLRA